VGSPDITEFPSIKEGIGLLNRRHGVLLRVVIGAAVLLLTCVFLWWLVSPNTPEQKTAFIQTIGTMVGGSALLFGLYFTARNLQVNREGQITERFTHAIDQLGSEKLEIRVGGIYALERIARDSERDHWPIMEVLAAYVTSHAPRRPEEDPGGEENAEVPRLRNFDPTSLAPDIQAIVTVLRRRTRYYRHWEPGREPERLNLSGANLSGADFPRAHLNRAHLKRVDLSVALLAEANLSEADLRGAKLYRANLLLADLSQADLSEADIRGAKLYQADLGEADLRGADLRGADLRGVDLRSANFREADLRGADLSGADVSAHPIGSERYGITQEQLEQAIGDKTTLLPDHLKRPAHWGAKTDE
jgi:pentapeptide repeat protein